VQITLIDDPLSLWPRRAEWNALAGCGATNTVFQTFEWSCSWWKTVGAGAQSLLLLAQDAGQIVGIAPLMLSERRILGRKRRVVEFIGTHAADYCDFIVAPSQRPVVSALLGWLVERAERWDLLDLINIAETSPLREALPRLFGERGYITDLQRLYECPTRVFGERAADLQASGKTSIRRHLNHLRKLGKVEFAVHTGTAQIQSRLDAFFQQHIDRWEGTSTPSFFRDGRQRAFYRELVASLAPRHAVLLSVLSVGQEAVSFHFGFNDGGRLYLIKPAFAPAYRRYAPGLLQIKFLFEHAMELGVREMDFTTGEEPYKYRFANHARVNYAVRVHRLAMFDRVGRALRYAKAMARRSPQLARLGRRVKPLLGPTLQRLGL